MNAKKLKAYARKQDTLLLTRCGGVQWLNVGAGIYPLTGWPEVNDEELLTVLDVPAKKQDGYKVFMPSGEAELYRGLLAELQPGEEFNVTLSSLTIGTARGAWVPVYTPEGLRFVQASALGIVSEEAAKHQIAYRRVGELETVVVFEGLLVAGVLLCQSGWIDSQTADELADAAKVASMIDSQRRAEEMAGDRQLKMMEEDPEE